MTDTKANTAGFASDALNLRFPKLYFLTPAVRKLMLSWSELRETTNYEREDCAVMVSEDAFIALRNSHAALSQDLAAARERAERAEKERDAMRASLLKAINRLDRYESGLPGANADLRAALTAPVAAGGQKP